jgi:uncharacterized repeat protein (TIGR02543 family)
LASAAGTDNYSFNSAGGSPTPSAGSGPDGTTITLPGAPVLAGYTFADWYDGNATYPASSSYLLSSNGAAILFTAQWNANATDNYSFNSAGGSPTPSAGSGPDGTTITLPGAPVLAGFTFAGWNDGSATHAAGASYLLASGGTAIHFTAQWNANATDTVAFNSEGGTAVGSMTAPNGSSITLPAAPTRPGYTFNGWFLAVTGGTALTSPYTLTGSLTLFAQWTDNGGGGGPGASTTITQTSPTKGVTSTKASSIFNPGAIVVTNNTGAVTFVTTVSSTGLTLSGNQISTTGALAEGNYTISGTDHDTNGHTGTWTYTLTVTNAIVQTSPTTGVTTALASRTFNPGSIIVTNNTGAVTFVTTVSSTGLSVTGGGVVTTKGALAAGSYTVSGTDSDAGGNTGTWKYTLTVSNLATTVTFNANGGKGTMTPERHSASTALTSNRFTRAGYTFVDWTTAANGSGATYANGATYPFTKTTTLFAQWRIGKAVARRVTFNGNGGAGAMAVERENTPTGLTGNRFTRAGYNFVDWNTAANGSGASYANGATYRFRKSTTLYAQWKVVKSTTVTFNAHGGRGAMPAEHHASPTALTINRFTRAGYTFVDWTTAANGSGARYANGATYPFTFSTTLYAQWRRHKVVVIPVIPATASVGPFALNSSTLSPALEAQIGNIASKVKTNRDTKILLVGYGDQLSAADARNESLWAANLTLSQHRASAVEAYLKQRLAALGVRGYTITAQGNGAVNPGVSTNQRNTGLVVAALT